MPESKARLTRPQAQQSQVIRSPFSLMRRMIEDMDRLFGDFPSTSVTWNPQIEVLERDGKLLVRADLPGLRREDVRVNVSGDELVIDGERRVENEKEEGGVFHSERAYGTFERRIPLPRGIDVSTCDATFENGVLEVQLTLPKEQRKAIDIKSHGAEAKPQPRQVGAGAAQNGPQTAPPRH